MGARDAQPSEGSFLKTIYESMENQRKLGRVIKVLRKRPEQRTDSELNFCVKYTEEWPIFSGLDLKRCRDVIHVMRIRTIPHLKCLMVPEMKPRIPTANSSFYWVLRGHLVARMKPAAGEKIPGKKGKDMRASSNGTHKERRASELQSTFAALDADGSGAVDVPELHSMFSSMGAPITLDDVQEMVDQVDKDGSGEIEYEEFVQICNMFEERLHDTWKEDPSCPGEWVRTVREG
eukprot:CAMPEP_0182895166 /NCGR_PEP_ID=MMETSP0034_2-20130328/25520_1 /TAXON_ID=156128 /ORGANISM="Nephroselmis pyriformis, Strain CCMP717" /LENGTH=233 /DNA_ID=CAMNT_0025028987 /DNA_START=266 /DNA_END=963 /DNA_ORIENTATION=-